MDHLAWHSSSPWTRPRVPYLCDEAEILLCDTSVPFDHWHTFLSGSICDTKSVHEAAKLCQTWLFFGLIRALNRFVGIDFVLHEYIDAQKHYIDSSPLQLLKTKIRTRLGLKSAKRTSLLGWLRKRASEDEDLELTQPDPDLTIESIISGGASATKLCEAWLREAIHDQLKQMPDCDPWNCELLNVFWSSLMLQGWLAEICYENAPQTLSFLPMLEGLRPAFRTSDYCPEILMREQISALDAYRLLSITGREGPDHHLCRHGACKEYDVANPDDYRPRHAKSCPRGDYCSLPTEITSGGLEELISRDAVPLVRSVLNKNGLLAVDIVDGSEIRNTTAISHVWAGGLGNFQANAHFYCQLKELHLTLMQKRAWGYASSETFYWLDTLCIPTQRGPLKTRAIDNMASVYARCETVLVIDPTLKELSAEQLDPQELCVAVLHSPWMQRSWTLQEGGLAVDLKLKFADCVLSFHHVLGRAFKVPSKMLLSLWDIGPAAAEYSSSMPLWESWATILYNEVVEDDHKVRNIHTSGMDTQRTVRRAETSQPPFEDVWNALSKRSTTEADDLAGIFAIYLDRSAGEVIELRTEQRMQALLRSQNKLPICLLFAPARIGWTQWCPEFPTCAAQSPQLSSSMGYMEMTPAGQLLIRNVNVAPSEPKSVLDRETSESASLAEFGQYYPICMYWPSDSITCSGVDRQITQLDRVPNILLIVPAIVHDGHLRLAPYGVCFQIVERTEHSHDEELQLRWLGNLDWHEINGSYKHHQPGSVPAPPATPGPSRISTTSTPKVHFGLYEVFKCEDKVPDVISLVLDMGMPTQPRLQWSRPTFYPFAQTLTDIARPLYLFIHLPIVELMYLFFNAIVVAALQNAPTRIVFSLIFGVTLTYVRYHLGSMEYAWIRNWTNRHLQYIWANSFKKELRPSDVNMHDTDRRAFRHAIIYGCALFLIAFAGLAYYISWSFRYGALHQTGIKQAALQLFVLTEPTSFVASLLKPVAVTVFMDMFCRVLIVLWQRRPWRPVDTSHSRLSWIVSFVKIACFMVGMFFCVLSYNLWYWNGQIKDRTKADVILTILVVFITVVTAGIIILSFFINETNVRRWIAVPTDTDGSQD